MSPAGRPHGVRKGVGTVVWNGAVAGVTQESLAEHLPACPTLGVQ